MSSARSHDDYTVACICALPLEMAAMKAMLDEIHSPLPQSPTDHNAYTLGKLNGHNVAIACLPSGVYGITSAATVLSQMQHTFHSFRFGLMIGIGGGVPSKSADIRLGDVVVSTPTATSGGVIQYDLGKTMSDGQFQRTGSLNKPPQVLLTAVSQVRSSCMMGEQSIKKEILNALEKHPEMREQFSRPQQDWLFYATYRHQGNEPECSACEQGQLVTRAPRATDDPQIHYGLIASGNRVMKDAQTRDSIAQELGILCFEMEAAGLMDLLPFLVIRGICDYCDSHKHKQWQGYAALAAAAYTKSLLSILPVVTNKSHLEQKTEFTEEEKACLQSLFLTNPVDDKNALKRRKGDRAAGTCEWLLKTDELIHWLDPQDNAGQIGSDVLWLYGNPGTGKSTMVITMTDELPEQPSFANGNKTLAYFFCDSSSENQRTAVAILRGLLYHLVKQCPMLIKHLVSKYVERKEALYTSFDALWAVLMEMGQDPSCEIYCIIDALDECEPESQQILLGQIHQSFQGGRTKSSPTSNPHILITSRPYPELSEYLSHFNHKDLASYSAVRVDLKAMIQEKVKDLAERKRYPERVTFEISQILEEKAEGTFLWVGIACDELKRVQSRNAVRTLEKLPPGLYALYQQLLNTALANNDEDIETIVDMLRLVAFARRPLTIPELSALCQLYPDYDENSRLQFTKELIDLCRLMIVIQDKRVRLLHKSVKDFLVKERHEINDLKVHADLANRCIDNMLDCGAFVNDRRLNSAFLEYAVKYWPEHAGLAYTEFVISPLYESFFEPTSKEWKQWLKRYNSLQQIQSQILEEGFCAFHTAAKWGIMPLISWLLGITTKSLGLPYTGDERIYNDAEFATISGLTPLEEAVRQGHTTVMDILLKKMSVGVGISEQVVIAAAKNWDNGKQVMTLLLNQQDQIQITEYVVIAASRNHKCGNDIMVLLLDHWGDQIPITEDVLKAAAENRGCGKEILAFLLDHWGDQIQITEDVLKAAAENRGCGKEILAFLLGHCGDQIQITEDVVIAAAGNGGCGKEILAFLLDHWGDQIQITEDVLKAAAGNNQGQQELTAFLLLQLEDQIKDGQHQLQISCWDGNMSNVKHLLTTGSDTNITNRCGWTPLHAACWNGHIDIVKLLLAHGASVMAISNSGWSPFNAAFTQGHIDIIRTLLPIQSGHIECFTPTCFSDKHKSEVLDLDHDKLGVRYVSNEEQSSRSYSTAGLVYADRPLSPLEDVYHFEIEVISLGDEGAIGLGFCKDSSSVDIMPGWNSVSWGYHGDNGYKYHSGGNGRPYGAKFREGDVIGCRLEVVSGKLEFTINGHCLGVAFTNVRGYLFPVIGMCRDGHIRANFTGPFIYNTKNP